MRWTLRRKLIFSITPLVAVAILLLATASYYSGAAAIRSQRDELLLLAANRADSALSAWIEESLRDAAILARTEAVLAAFKAGRADEASRVLKTYLGQSPHFENLALISPDGVVLADGLDGKSVGLDLRKLGDLQPGLEAVSRPRVRIGDFKRSPVTGRLVSLMIAPVVEKDALLGFLALPLDVSVFIRRFVTEAEFGRTGRLILLDSKGGTPQSDSDGQPRDISHEPFAQAMLSKPEGFEDYVWQGVGRRLTWKANRVTNWTLAAAIDQEEFSEQLNQLAWLSGLFGLLTVLGLAGALDLTVTRSMTRPLAELVRAADRIAAGDFGSTLELPDRHDEVGALARAFRRMTDSLAAIATTFEAVASGDLRTRHVPQSDRDRLGRALVRMLANLQEVNRKAREGVQVLAASIGQISAAASQLSAGSMETATALTQTSATVEEVRQTAALSSQKARAVAEAARRAAQAAQAGQTATRDIGQAMRLISAKMDAISANIARLSEKSQLIGEIISSVGEVADQSNILAVNAAIEASRAGEEGRGFAVVAREIRLLADQSKQATMQVRDILQEIQSATIAAVLAAEQGGGAVKDGEKQTQTAGQAIGALGGSVDESCQASAQIAASIQEQLAGVEQVALAMDNIRQASDQNLRGVSQLGGSVRDLDKLAQELKALLEHYKT